jgi:hypothetical protein
MQYPGCGDEALRSGAEEQKAEVKLWDWLPAGSNGQSVGSFGWEQNTRSAL